MTSDTHVESRVPLFIGGEVVEPADWSAVIDPATPAEVVGHAAAATEKQARAAVSAAHVAWPNWSAMAAEERAGQLTAALDALHGDEEERARILVRENGKVLGEARIELHVFEARCRLAAALASELRDVRSLDAPPFRSEVTTLSMGVVTIIVPYNWPLAILAASLPYALVAGNPVVVKPPPTTPLAMVHTLCLVAERLPAGVLNVVTGSNEAVEPVIRDPRVRKLVFTGSTGAGRAMMTMAAENMTRVTLELGGNDAALVLDDAELDDAAIERLVVGSFLTTGQVCMGIKRLYVHRSRYDEVVERMSERLDREVVGHGLAPETTMGPLNNARQRDFVAELAADARTAGDEVRELGAIADVSADTGGFFLRPALVLDPAVDRRIVTEEQFGPLLPILPFDDVDTAVAAVNDDWSGLCSSVWSADEERARSLAHRLRTGTTWVNNHNAVAQDDRAPFGGFRLSGMGRELGVEGLYDFTEAHTVTYPARPEQLEQRSPSR
jgi:acyl-CoA reductase-like NAD-dependent aldehyde dehydrogenase